MDGTAIEQIIAQYKKHGWKLRRVLLSAGLSRQIGDSADLFEGVEAAASELDAAWFSRSTKPGITAWELRHLSETPYALVTGIDEGIGADESEAILRETEMKMLNAGVFRKLPL